MDDPHAPVRPPAPGLPTELAESGRRLFRWRSYVPLVVLAYLVLIEAMAPLPHGRLPALVVGAGMLVGALGLGVRFWAVGQVRPGTSGRSTRVLSADELNTDGLYSVVRHPLYLGNFLLWMGVALGGGRMAGVLVTALFFWVYYERIMAAEERFLFTKFGRPFEAWCTRTPAFLPRWSAWRASEMDLSLRFALGRDYHAVFGFVAATTTLQITRSFALGSGGRLALGWWIFFLAGLAYYAVLHGLRTRTHVLDVPGR